MAAHHFPWRDAFLAALRSMPVIGPACRAVGIDRSTAWRARQADPEFAKEWDDAMEDGVDRAEQEAFRRGAVGFEELVVHQGQLTPVWERDEQGRLVYEFVDCDPYKVGDETVTTQRVARQARDTNGNLVWLTVRKHSDAMLGLVLKARRATYRVERTELTGPDGAAINLDATTRSARVKALLSEARARRAAEDFG